MIGQLWRFCNNYVLRCMLSGADSGAFSHEPVCSHFAYLPILRERRVLGGYAAGHYAEKDRRFLPQAQTVYGCRSNHAHEDFS
jgi:hypothetical protein